MKQKLKIGFDLDGVLLYNPARIIRPLISTLKEKEVCIHRKELEFYVPQKKWEELMWELFHKSSIFVAPGFDQIKKLRNKGLIEPYLVTGRYAHLKNDFEHWKKKMGAEDIFKKTMMNDKNQQPHLYKEKIIKQFDLDIFIEDNWDIVNYLAHSAPTLNKKNSKKRQILWITNFIDSKKIDYQFKFNNLKQVLAHICLQIA
ncbi:MAG: hypothetical protein U9O78_04255 [Patescibacteria group bacterium]|nr:hypothetical protein [Patescibacteria group bacterium]